MEVNISAFIATALFILIPTAFLLILYVRTAGQNNQYNRNQFPLKECGGGSGKATRKYYLLFFRFPPIIKLIHHKEMNHMELGPSTIIGIALVMVGILLYALKKREPYVSRGVIF